MDFSYENFKEKESVFEGFLYRYESEIENIALDIEAHLQKNQSTKNHC
jgi:hypothetical protein